MYLSSCCMYFSPPSKSRPNESRRFWTMLNIGLICKTPFMSPVAEIENDASYWTELHNWIGLVLYHLIYTGTSNCSNQDMIWMKLILLEFCYTYPCIHHHNDDHAKTDLRKLNKKNIIIKNTLRNVPISYSERFVTFQNTSRVWWSILSSPREDNC